MHIQQFFRWISCVSFSALGDDIPDYVLLEIEASSDVIEKTDSVVAIFTITESQNEAPSFTTGDFGGGTTQTVGYPDFVYLESFIAMPLTKVFALDSEDQEDVRYSVTSSGGDFYIDDTLGFVYAYPSDAVNIGDLCGDSCQLEIEADDGNGEKSSITVRIVPVGEDEVVPLDIIQDDATPEEVINHLNLKFQESEYWFREVQYQPTKDDESLRDEGDAVIYVTILDGSGSTSFVNRNQISR